MGQPAGYSAKTASGRAKMKKAGKPVGQPKQEKEPKPIHMDFSGADEPEDKMPDIVKKGSL